MVDVDKYRIIKKGETFSDVYNSFAVHPDTGELLRKVDNAAIDQSLKNLILTAPYERPFSNKGSSIVDQLFENYTPQLESKIVSQITNLVETREPRANLQQVKVVPSPDMNKIAIYIAYIPVYQTQVQQLRILVNRVR